MKKLLLLLGLLLAPSAASAQCTGIFPPSTLCGNLSGVPGPPAAYSVAGTAINALAVRVASNTALLASPTTLYPSGVWRDTYGNGNGADPLFYQPSGSACTLNAGNGDNGSQVKSSDGKCWIALYPGYWDVREFGADPSGASDNSTACIAALSALSLTAGGKIVFPPGTYKFTSSCAFPRFTNGTVEFELTGATLSTTAAINIFSRTPTDNTDANVIIAAKFVFRNGTFQGNSTTNQRGIFLGASYGSEVTGTVFNQLDVGFLGAFALKTMIRGCFGFLNVTNTIRLASANGLWSGATTNNSQSNVSTIDSCRDYASVAQSASFEVLASDQVTIKETISEGNHPVNNIHFDTQGSTTVKSLLLRSVHSENSPTNAIIKLDGAGADIDVYNIIDQGAGGYLTVDASTYSAGSISIESMPIVATSPATPLFTDGGGGQFWRFQDFGGGNVDPTNPVYWTGGSVPSSLVGIGRYPAGSAGSLFCSDCVIGTDNAVANSNHGNHSAGNLFFNTDDTYGFGTAANGPTNATGRPHHVSVGTGGIITEGDITPRVDATGVPGGTLIGNSLRTFAGVQLGPVTVANLPACGGGTTGQIRYVSDANSTTYNSTAAGGGSNKLLVLCNGTNWTLH